MSAVEAPNPAIADVELAESELAELFAADDALLIAALLAVDPSTLGGVVLDHPVHEQARAFTDALQAFLPTGAPMRRVPIGVSADRLIGGVDLPATLRTGRLVSERGVLAAADGGLVVVPMAERASVSVRTTLCEVLDRECVQVARDGIATTHDVRIVAVLLDEAVDDEAIHAALIDRVAFRLVLRESVDRDAVLAVRSAVVQARATLHDVQVEDTWVTALCETTDAFGIDSLRAPLMALRCACAHAALHGRASVSDADAETAARLVLTPRATRLPAPPEPPADEQSPPPPESSDDEQAPPPDAQQDEPPPPDTDDGESPDDDSADEQPLPSAADLLRAAVAAALPPGLLAQLMARANSGSVQGRVGAEEQSFLRGRPRGARAGLPRGGARLHLLETLRTAAPWQRVRGRVPGEAVDASVRGPRVAIRREDFRIRRFVEKTGTTVIFLVDASGSAALQRLSEAKGAIELLLAESYARRDRVCLIAFRGTGTDMLLPPTRALARAKKVLAALPGGGGTPIATAIDVGLQQALATRRDGSSPLVVVLSDGRANIARDGTPGRPGAERDALAAGAVFAQFGISTLFVDTSPRGEAVARRIADSMRARYVFLPYADASALGGLVKTAMQL